MTYVVRIPGGDGVKIMVLDWCKNYAFPQVGRCKNHGHGVKIVTLESADICESVIFTTV